MADATAGLGGFILIVIALIIIGTVAVWEFISWLISLIF